MKDALDARRGAEEQRQRESTRLVRALQHRAQRAFGNADEVEENAALPRNLDQQVFAYFDELEGMRASVAAMRRTLAATAAAPGHEAAAQRGSNVMSGV